MNIRNGTFPNLLILIDFLLRFQKYPLRTSKLALFKYTSFGINIIY